MGDATCSRDIPYNFSDNGQRRSRASGDLREEAAMSERPAIIGPEEILSYWFPPGINEADADTWGQRMGWWFAGGPEVDKEITQRFAAVLEQARRGELDWWADTPRGRLALIIVLDQFSRNIYRGSPLAYAQDPAALELALSGIEVGMDRDLTFTERIFFRLPLTHSEDLAIHERIVRGAEEAVAADDWPAQLPRAWQEFMLEQAKGARDVIARFGRYPHRNEVLGRTSTPEELEYLRTETPVHLRRPTQQ
jgi:uncharacterized protein (DUF924 family)